MFYTCCCQLYRLVPMLLHLLSNFIHLVPILFIPVQLCTFLIFFFKLLLCLVTLFFIVPWTNLVTFFVAIVIQ